MEKLRCVIATDQVNLYNEKILLSALVDVYERQYKYVMPLNVNHDRTKPIGCAQLSGIYIEPGKASLLANLDVWETEEEKNGKLEFIHKSRLNNLVHDEGEKYKELFKKLGDILSENYKLNDIDSTAIINEGIVSRIFPEMDLKMKKGLYPLRDLEPVLPGIYKKGEYLIYAHEFFRRQFSRCNTLNSPFLERFEGLKHKNVEAYIALDMDMIGLAGTESIGREYQYWWGPKFDDDLSRIPHGVTRHINEKYDRVINPIERTEFGWYMQDGKQTFECEELIDIPNIINEDDEHYACRFVHSMVDFDDGAPFHLDGAVRVYSEEKMIKRLDLSLDQTEKDTEYKKLWRIDNPFSVELWKELISHYYRDNTLVGEYFDGKDSVFKKTELTGESVLNEASKGTTRHDRVLQADMGTIFSLKFINSFQMNPSYNIVIQPYDTGLIEQEEMNHYVVEVSNLIDFLEKDELRIWGKTRVVEKTNDDFINFPWFICNSRETACMVQKNMRIICDELSGQDTFEGFISYTIVLSSEEKGTVFSFAGHVKNINHLLEAIGDELPEELNLESWVEKLSVYLKTFELNCSQLNIFDMVNENGGLSFK